MDSVALHDLIDRLRALVADVPRDQLPKVAGALAEAQARVLLRLQRPLITADEPTNGRMSADDPEPLVDVNEAAELLDVQPRWLYRRADDLPFTRRLSARTLRFSKPGIARWLKTRR